MVKLYASGWIWPSRCLRISRCWLKSHGLPFKNLNLLASVSNVMINVLHPIDLNRGGLPIFQIMPIVFFTTSTLIVLSVKSFPTKLRCSLIFSPKEIFSSRASCCCSSSDKCRWFHHQLEKTSPPYDYFEPYFVTMNLPLCLDTLTSLLRETRHFTLIKLISQPCRKGTHRHAMGDSPLLRTLLKQLIYLSTWSIFWHLTPSDVEEKERKKVLNISVIYWHCVVLNAIHVDI